MKRFIPVIALLLLFCSTPALAWNCSDPLASRVPVPAGTSGSYGSGDGQLFLGTGSEGTKGQLYQCQVPNPSPTPSSPASLSNSQNQQQSNSQQQSQSNSQNSTQNTSNQNVSSSGSTSKSASNANSQSNNSNSNTNNNSLKATGGTSTSFSVATGGTSTATASNNATGSGNTTTFSSVDNQVRQTPMAYAPDAAFTTSPCTKGYSGGVSFPLGAGTAGFSKTDKGCDTRQTAVIFHAIGNDSAAAILLCSTDAAKRAHLTLEQCGKIVVPAPVVVAAPAPSPAPAPQIIVVPAPVAAPAPVPVVPTITSRTQIHSFGTCKMPNAKPTNVCYRLLDDAILSLEQNTSEKLILTGPVESVKVVEYVKKRIDSSRVELRVSDDQNYNLTIKTLIEE